MKEKVSQGSSLMVHWVKDPVLSLVWIGLLLAWVPSLAWELPHTMGEAKRKKKEKLGVPIVAQWVKDPMLSL